MKKIILIIVAAVMVILLILFVLFFISRPGEKYFGLEKESWVVNLCGEYNNPSSCRRVSTQKASFLSEEQLRWWFSFQEPIGKSKDPLTREEYDQYWADKEKFDRMVPFIDEHIAKIIAQANPIGSTELETWPMYVFPRSRISQAEITDTLNRPEKWDEVVKDGEFPNVHYDMRIKEKPVSDIVVGAKIVGKIIEDSLCRQRASHNFLIDMVQKKIIYLDRELEFDSKNCQIKR